jgi:hypothetical protein
MRKPLLVAACALGLGSAACGTDFQPAADVDSLRVLAIQADHPIATPGTTVSLTMLSYDGSPKAKLPDGTARPVTIAWFGGCENPAGDAFYRCYDHATLAPKDGSGVVSGKGTTFSVPISPTILTSRGKASGTTAAYGLAMVLYAVCGGTLVQVTPTDTSAPPIGCVDATGAPVTAQDFVFGYLPIYVYDPLAKISTTNPVVTPGSFNGRTDAPATCNATTPCTNGDQCGSAGVCLPVVPKCTERDTTKCPKYSFMPTVDMSSIETDAITLAVDHKTEVERIYVNYYSYLGSVADGSKSIEAPNLGWNADYGTTWSAPDRGGQEARVFAVVRNNRGGVSWWTKDVYVQ